MPPYAFMPIVAASAAADRNAVTEPRWPITLLPAVCRPTRPSVAPSRMASQAPSAISQMARAGRADEHRGDDRCGASCRAAGSASSPRRTARR